MEHWTDDYKMGDPFWRILQGPPQTIKPLELYELDLFMDYIGYYSLNVQVLHLQTDTPYCEGYGYRELAWLFHSHQSTERED